MYNLQSVIVNGSICSTGICNYRPAHTLCFLSKGRRKRV